MDDGHPHPLHPAGTTTYSQGKWTTLNWLVSKSWLEIEIELFSKAKEVMLVALSRMCLTPATSTFIECLPNWRHRAQLFVFSHSPLTAAV